MLQCCGGGMVHGVERIVEHLIEWNSPILRDLELPLMLLRERISFRSSRWVRSFGAIQDLCLANMSRD